MCDGNPYDCRAFVVGINAASNVPFWDFWDDNSGFDKKRWYDCYIAKRGTPDRKPVSATRERIARVTSAAAPVKVLETNLFSGPTAKRTYLRQSDMRTDILEFLLRTITPKVILVHGKVVKEHFEGICDRPLSCRFSRATIYGKPVQIAAVRFLAFVSYEGATMLGKTICRLVK